MVQRRRSPRFLRETLQTIGISGKRCWQNFDCDIAVQPRVSRPINLAHAAGPNWRMNLVRPQHFSGGECHRWVAIIASFHPQPSIPQMAACTNASNDRSRVYLMS